MQTPAWAGILGALSRPLPAQGSPVPWGALIAPTCVCMGTTFAFFSLQPSSSPHTKDTFLGGEGGRGRKGKEKMYFFSAFQLPELSEGMNGLGKISHRNKFTRDS